MHFRLYFFACMPLRSVLKARQGPAFDKLCHSVVQVGVLTRHILDDGRGFARSKVFKHGHEEATGRTSSIGQHNLCVSRQQAFRNHKHCECSFCLVSADWQHLRMNTKLSSSRMCLALIMACTPL